MSEAENLNLNLNSLGERMRFRRRELGLTQDELALLSGTNQAVIQKIENGKSLRPRKLDVIADALNITPSWLLYGEEKTHSSPPRQKKSASYGCAYLSASNAAFNVRLNSSFNPTRCYIVGKTRK
jgi:transcriptional regulator with XRE-family HTH domain